jgi:hypothetical protein
MTSSVFAFVIIGDGGGVVIGVLSVIVVVDGKLTGIKSECSGGGNHCKIYDKMIRKEWKQNEDILTHPFSRCYCLCYCLCYCYFSHFYHCR